MQSKPLTEYLTRFDTWIKSKRMAFVKILFFPSSCFVLCVVYDKFLILLACQIMFFFKVVTILSIQSVIIEVQFATYLISLASTSFLPF